jgi:hypothetical protein
VIIMADLSKTFKRLESDPQGDRNYFMITRINTTMEEQANLGRPPEPGGTDQLDL